MEHTELAQQRPCTLHSPKLALIRHQSCTLIGIRRKRLHSQGRISSLAIVAHSHPHPYSGSPVRRISRPRVARQSICTAKYSISRLVPLQVEAWRLLRSSRTNTHSHLSHDLWRSHHQQCYRPLPMACCRTALRAPISNGRFRPILDLPFDVHRVQEMSVLLPIKLECKTLLLCRYSAARRRSQVSCRVESIRPRLAT